MSWVSELAEAAVPPLLELAYKLVSGQITTKEEAIHAVAGVATAAGIADGLAAKLTSADAASTKEMLGVAQAAVYPGEKP